MKKLLSSTLMLFGIACYVFVSYGFIERTQPKRVSFAYAKEIINTNTPSPVYTSQPILINIPSLDIQLPIIPSQITNNEWQATTEGVSYLIHSPIPGEYGNSILYGHNWPNLLGKLPQIKIGDEVIITYEDQSTRTFEIHYTTLVTPDQVEILAPSKDKRITLYTCTGFLDSHRFVAVGIVKE